MSTLFLHSLNAHVRLNSKTILSGTVKALTRKASKAKSELFSCKLTLLNRETDGNTLLALVQSR